MQTTRRPRGRGLADGRADGGFDAVGLAVHRVLLERLRRDRPERVEADAQLDLDHLAARAQALPQLGREVQARGGRRRAARRARVDRLVALVGHRRVADVGRQRHAPGLLERPLELGTGQRRAARASGPPPRPRPARSRARPRARPAAMPGRVRREGRTSASQRPSARSSISRTSPPPPVGRRTAMRARSTRLLLTTTRSPGSSRSTRSSKRRCSIVPSRRCTSRREASRRSAGRCAISSSGSA